MWRHVGVMGVGAKCGAPLGSALIHAAIVDLGLVRRGGARWCTCCWPLLVHLLLAAAGVRPSTQSSSSSNGRVISRGAPFNPE